MATGAITMLLSQNDNLLYEVEQKIKAEGEKQVAKAMEELIDPNQLLSQLGIIGDVQIDPINLQFSFEITGFSFPATQKEFDRIEGIYFKIKAQINKIKAPLEGAKNMLLKLKSTIQKVENAILKINEIFQKLDSILKVLDIIVTVAKITVSVVGSIPSTSTTPIPAGPILKANDIITLVGGKIKTFKALISSISGVLPYYLDKVTKNFDILDQAIAALDELIGYVNILIQLLDRVYLELLRHLTLQNPSLTSTSPGGVNPLDAASTPEDLYAQVEGLGVGSGAGLEAGLEAGLVFCTLSDGSLQPMTPEACLAAGGTFGKDESEELDDSIEGFVSSQPEAYPEPGILRNKEFIEYSKEKDGKKRGYRRYKK